MRLADVALVGSLCVVSACGSDENKQASQKTVDLSPEQQNELRELEAKVKLLEKERAELFENMPSVDDLEKTKHELEDRKNRIEALQQRGKVIPCAVAELARIVSEGTSIDVVEIAAESMVIELPVADGSKFEPNLNSCGALGTGKKIDGGWGWEAKLFRIEAAPREKSPPEAKPKRPPRVSVLSQLPQRPAARLDALRDAVEAIGSENADLRKKHDEMAELVEQKESLAATERSLRTPPDVEGTVEAVEEFAKAAGVELKSVRPEPGNTVVRIHVEMNARLLDIDTLFVKLQTRPTALVVETLVFKPGNGEQAVPVRMTLATPRM